MSGFRSLALSSLFLGTLIQASPVAAREWSEVVASGHLRVGVKENTPPLGFRDADGNLVGFEIDIAREIARQLLGPDGGLDLIPLANQDRLNAVASGQVDLVIAQVGVTPDRARIVDFSPPYYLDGTVFAVPAAAGIRRWSDLTQTGRSRVAVLNGSGSIPALKAVLPQLPLTLVPSYESGIAQLQAGTVSGFAADASILSGWIRSNPNYQLLTPPLASVALAIALPRGTASGELNQKVTHQIERWRESGWLIQKAREWGLP